MQQRFAFLGKIVLVLRRKEIFSFHLKGSLKLDYPDMINKTITTLLILNFLFLVGGVKANAPFTVLDSISRNRLYDVVYMDSWNTRTPFILSPDGLELFVVVGAGLPEKSTYKFKLISFHVPDIVDYVRNKKNSPPKERIWISLYYNQNNPDTSALHSAGIKEIKFFDEGRFLTFIGHDNDERGQVYAIELASGKISRLTNSSRGVIQYFINEKKGEIIFFEKSYKLDRSCERVSFIVGVEGIFNSQCLADGSNYYQNKIKSNFPLYFSNIYRVRINKNRLESLIIKDFPVSLPFDDFVISPDGAKALAPIYSDMYTPGKIDGPLKDKFYEDYDENVGKKFAIKTHYAVVDLENGNYYELKKFPIDRTSEPETPRWLTDNSILLGDSIISDVLSTNVESNAEHRFISHSVSGTDRYDRGVVVNIGVDRDRFYVKDFFQYNDRASWKVVNDSKPDNRRNVTASVVARCNQYQPIDLNSVNEHCRLEIPHYRVYITTGESYRSQPNLYVKDLITGQIKIFFELNPEFKGKLFGAVELMQWTDANGKTWQGSLIYPTNYRPGRRYPIVVQTHGFDPGHYVFDGPPNLTAPYAGQALANKGMFVLNIPDEKFDAYSDEHSGTAAGISAGVKLLYDQGKIDISKVGLIGYSATGSLVFNMALFPDFVPAAVTIVDAFSQSEMGYAYLYGSPGMGMKEIELLYCGAQPWGETVQAWVERSPLHNIDRLRTPVRIEDHHGMPSGWWDIFAGLRRLNAPVEYVIYTTGKHPSQHPDAVFQSQEANVDWFDFWLNNRTVDDTAKADQYRRWMDLKRKLAAMNPSVRPYTPMSHMTCNNELDDKYEQRVSN
ncbi:hypothetical protein [Pedomonas sp. V897]|uniref:hypothetical protein n=1 Tax=Pedomonas sp. V897 TaxID=3446482 RepID=UPI003EE1C646